MTIFSPEWLSLREAADTRARNTDIAQAVAAWFTMREHVSVIDLGSGTGANLRATSALLPPKQTWMLVDHDAALIPHARDALARWADSTRSEGDTLHLTKAQAEISVLFKTVDLAHNLDAALGEKPDLVTASALFDLVSPVFIRELATQMAARRAAFYGVLTYNGIQRWSPHRPADNQMMSAFHQHQLRDKGFGIACGPMAPAELADQFRLNGYNVLEGDSTWRLEARDRTLIEELQRGHALAVLETKAVDSKTVETWVKVKRANADVGHTDTFAAPGSTAS